MDNGPEYVSNALRQWAEDHGITLNYIQPGKPQQNTYVERYNRNVRHEWLGQYNFSTMTEVQDHATQWLWTYNNKRLNMVLGGITSVQKLNRQWQPKSLREFYAKAPSFLGGLPYRRVYAEIKRIEGST